MAPARLCRRRLVSRCCVASDMGGWFPCSVRYGFGQVDEQPLTFALIAPTDRDSLQNPCTGSHFLYSCALMTYS